MAGIVRNELVAIPNVTQFRNGEEVDIGGLYPIQPNYDQKCRVNSIYRTIPTNYGWNAPSEMWVEGQVGPSSVKSLYTGIPNYYPNRRTVHPKNTLYGQDMSQFDGAGKRLGYTYMVHPFKNRYVTEVQEYSGMILPYAGDMNKVTQYPVKSGITLNNPNFTL